MLIQEENELITRVGPGTPMGNLFREYWLPAMLAEELPAPDSDPVRVLILGEQLIAFRDTNGKIGLLANNCPHRGASLFFGRNEEAGLRCVYHGWKFDTSGTCIDMPNHHFGMASEPAESDFKSKVKATAYPTPERGGIVWAHHPVPDAHVHHDPRARGFPGVLHCGDPHRRLAHDGLHRDLASQPTPQPGRAGPDPAVDGRPHRSRPLDLQASAQQGQRLFD